MIDLTPLEVRKKKGEFKRAMRGYEPALVDDFLDLVADRMEELVRENLTLSERSTRTEQQVTEYRDRERALTEALVTAQEMREEVRRQATREAELSLKSAHQEAAELRSSAEQAAAQLRSSAEQAAMQLRMTAEQEAARLRREAEQESAQLRAAAQQEVAQLRASALQAKEREEGAASELRERQQQVLTTYQNFLERELAELRSLAQRLGLGESGEAPEAHRTPRRSEPPVPPVMPELTASIGGFAAGVMVSHALEQELPADDEGPDVDVFNEPDLGGALLDAGIEDELDTAGDDPTIDDLVLLDDDLPPFEPEPVVPDEDELELYDGLAEPEPEAGLPGAIGLGDLPASGGWSTPADWKVPGIDLVPDGSTPADTPDEDEDDDEETSLLLRNAAAAGYRLPDEEELLLEEAVDGEDEDDDDDTPSDGGWLPSLLDDDRDDRFDA